MDTNENVVAFAITGMTCGSCKRQVEAALNRVPGVSAAEVDLLRHTAKVHYNASIASPQDLVDAVHDAGYEVANPKRVKQPKGGCGCGCN